MITGFNNLEYITNVDYNSVLSFTVSVIISVNGVERLDVYKEGFDSSDAFEINKTKVNDADESIINNWMYIDEGHSVTFKSGKE